ncbi:MAG: hypothetical protein U0R24_03625 [Solirubrobacterales bacterium]
MPPGGASSGRAAAAPTRSPATRTKRRTALAAAALVEEGSTVGLTGGTTTTEVARALSEVPDLTIVTNALNIASELAIRSNLKLVVPGGVARSASYELVGPIAESALGGLNLDVVFVGVDGIAPQQGLTTHHEVEAYTNRVLIQRAARSIAVADSSKLGRVAFARICDADEVDGLISDAEADREVIDALEALGIDVKLV